MALFRKKNQPVTDDFQTQRDYKPIAWLLAAVTFFVTLLLVLIIFFAGRWTWNKIFNKSKDDGNSTSQNGGIESIDGTTPTNKSNSNEKDKNNQTQGTTNNSGPQTSSTSTNTPSRATAQPNTQPNTGPSQELVNTGPDADL